MVVVLLLLVCYVDTDDIGILSNQRCATSCAFKAYLDIMHFHDLLLIRVLCLGFPMIE